ncbi:expressed unknown protein [Seminavis robusta]|uniref:Uncharacterized protein n=1 Tax=Seminavis robusta TaxID=568900 RepID=A0A9N8DGK7_9STRA|nr:expressed unknown protein [Seminavis robusta]|eukprot:Sro109_g054640.1 n/a (261) ;mRNA; f:87150-87932
MDSMRSSSSSERDGAIKSAPTLTAKYWRMLTLFTCIVGHFIMPSPQRLAVEDPNTCAYVPGAGFSGFFFTMGRLQTVQEPTSLDYYCYSAGCLASTATLGNITTGEALSMALNAQEQWMNGTISRFDVVSQFVDSMIAVGQERTLNAKVLSKLRIITTKSNGWLQQRETVIRTPKSLEDLKTMLVQTTWIPGATGNAFSFEEHSDGAFSSATHPSCPTTVGLPQLSRKTFSFFANLLNMNLKPAQAHAFSKSGMELGLQR